MDQLVIYLTTALVILGIIFTLIIVYFIWKAIKISQNDDIEVVVVRDIRLSDDKTGQRTETSQNKPKTAKTSNSISTYDDKINNAKKTCVLNLSDEKLQRFPELLDIGPLLRSLDLSKNNITALPETITQLTSLRYLSLDSNQLTELAEELGSLNSLEVLSANNNKLEELPKSFSELSNLRSVSLSHNQFQTFPLALCRLKRLNYIDLSENQITQIPVQIQDLNATELNLNLNRISSLPQELSDCKRLKVLRINNNCLPITAITKPILSDSKIAVLTLEGNGFDVRKIRELDGYEDLCQKRIDSSKKLESIDDRLSISY